MALVRDPYSTAEAFLAAHPGVRFFDLLLPDLCGVLRGKRIDRADLAGIYQRGVFLPGSMFALDMQGGTVQATGLGFDEGDADRACVPVPGTLFPTPWLGQGIAQLQVQMLDHDGGPFWGDPRHVLDAVLDRYAARGWRPVVAVELDAADADALIAELWRVTRPGGWLLFSAPIGTGLADSDPMCPARLSEQDFAALTTEPSRTPIAQRLLGEVYASGAAGMVPPRERSYECLLQKGQPTATEDARDREGDEDRGGGSATYDDAD